MISARLVQHVKVSEYYDEMREIYGDSESFETLWKDLDPVQDDILAYLCTQHCSRQDMLVLLHQIIRVLSKKSSIGNAASWIDFLNQWFQKTGLTPDIINAFISEYFVILTTENLGASGTTWSSIPDELVKYYMLLGLEASANRDDLKKAWRAAAKKYHPDVSGPDHANRMQFMAMNEAWEVLEKNIH